MKTRKERRAYSDGYDAGQNNRAIDNNPYSSSLKEEWESGWRSGHYYVIYDQGREAANNGLPPTPPADKDSESWLAGYNSIMDLKHFKPFDPVLDALNKRDQYWHQRDRDIYNE